MSKEYYESDQTSDNIEQDDKVKVEEACINLGCVKKQLDEGEFEFEEKQYKLTLTYQNIFGESSRDKGNNLDTLIGFLDDDVIMETGTFKLEDVKEENKELIRKTIKQSHCNGCGGNYAGYCLNCSSLSHILNNVTPNVNPEPILNTTPTSMLEIREVSGRQAVFALKTLPKGIMLGPFEGVAPIESTTGLQWKIKDRKLVNDQNGNWMKYIESVASYTSKNLDIFQFDGILYFETSREIQEGEELLLCFGEEDEVLKTDSEKEFYLVPVKKEEYPKVFACTRCCLGFRLERCLVEHKRRCPQGDPGCSIEDFEIIQCRSCKVWLDKEEHLERHRLHCLENYNKLHHNLSNVQPTNVKIGETHSNTNEKTDKCLKRYRNTANDVESFECSYGKRKLTRIDSLKLHITNEHLNMYEKEYKCSECSYQTNYKGGLKQHINTHSDIKPFECDTCKKSFRRKCHLNVHIKTKHSNASEKEYKCSECFFQTHYKNSLKQHLKIHNGIKPLECDACKMRFIHKITLKMHVENKHSNTGEKKYKCSECLYQTNKKMDLEGHLNTHNDIKPFECDVCNLRFSHKGTLKMHVENKHSNTSEKKYRCSDCSYQTNHKASLNLHINTHNDINAFQCDTCKKKFAQKASLKLHIENKHANTSEKEYKFSDCSHQTNYKANLKTHANTHNDINPFQCDTCKMRFRQKDHLKRHIIAMHSKTSEKKYKCTECSYKTNSKQLCKRHINTLKGLFCKSFR